MLSPAIPRWSSAHRAAAVLALAGSALLFWLFRGLRLDDAYITLQFARNVGSGHGFVFNDGARVFGSTSPLHVLIFAGVYAVAGDVLAPGAIVIGAAAVGAQAFLLFLIFEKTSRPLAWLVGGLVLAGFTGSYKWLALETNLFAALVLGTLWALTTRREVLCGGLLGLAFLSRYDAALFVPICVFLWWLEHRAFPYRLLMTTLIVVAPWLAWAALYFGSILPRTLYAKQHITERLHYFSLALRYCAGAPWISMKGLTHRLLASVTPIAWLSGLVFAWIHARQVFGLLLYGAALLAAYSLIGPDAVQYWHFYVTEMALDLLLIMGTAGWLIANYQRRMWNSPLVGALPVGVVSVLLVFAAVRQTADHARSYPSDFWLGKRHGRYVEFARWLQDDAQPPSAVMAREVGTIGYLSRMRMMDPYGLINDTNMYPRSSSLENLAEFVDRSHPDVLLVDGPDQGAFFEQRSSFRMVKVFEWDPWSTVLVRGPDVLKQPASFAALRAALPDRARAAIAIDSPPPSISTP